MRQFLTDQLTFFRQFRTQFKTTGSILPSGKSLARAITAPMRRRSGPARILEIGPGTGAFTHRLVRELQPGDQLDLVELNPIFARTLEDKFETDPAFVAAKEQSRVHVCPLQDFRAEAKYDYVVSGLPLNNFPTGLVREIFSLYFDHLADGGVLSYFEYMYVRPIRRVVSPADERKRMRELDEIAGEYIDRYRFKRSWVFVNVPPAWVQHLRKG